MAFEAQYVSGDVLAIDHTPGSAVSAGQVVVQGDLTAIAHRDIAASALGALCIGGVYTVTAAGAYATVGTKVYWDDSANKVTTTSSGNKVFGVTLEASAGDGSAIKCLHMPGF